MPLLLRLSCYFFLFAFIGWLAEVIFHAVNRREFSNRGFLNGPLCPIYGVGTVIIYLVCTPASDTMLPLFLLSAVLCSALELLTGIILEKAFHTRWWDYSSNRLNLGGYICLSMGVVWGILGIIIMRIVLPLTDLLLGLIPDTALLIIVCVAFPLLAVDLAASVATVAKFNRQMKLLSELSERLRAGSDAVGKKLSDNTIKIEEHLELKQKYEKLASDTGLLRRRILKAFPELRSTRYNEQLAVIRSGVSKLKSDAAAARSRFKAKQDSKNRRVSQYYETKIVNRELRPFAFGMGPAKLFWLFMVGSALGSVIETVWCLLTRGHFEMRTGLVIGLFIPVYGIGAVVMAALLCRMYKKRDVWIFVGSALIGAAVEYFCSLFQELVFGTVSWDYTGTVLSLGGRTNLMFALIWGCLGVIWVKDLYPLVSRLIEKIPKKAGRALTAVLAIFIVLDIALSFAAVWRRMERSENIPPDSAFEEYLDSKYPDELIDFIYPNMVKTNEN